MLAMTRHRPPDGPPPEPPILSGRVPPNDLSAEAVVLTECLLDPSKMTVVRAVFGEDESDVFYSDNHRLIFDAMADLDDRREPVDLISVKHWLEERQLIQRAGGAKYLGVLIGETPSTGNVERVAQIVSKMKGRRKLISLAQKVAGEGYGVVDEHWFSKSIAELNQLSERPTDQGWTVLDSVDIFEELPPIPWVVEELEIAPGPPTMFAGYGYSKKTLTTQAIGMAVASGRDALGRWAVRQGKVVHVDYEQGGRLTRERYQRLARGMGVEPHELVGQLEVVPLPRTYLDTPNAESVYCRHLEGATLAIVDSLRAAAPSVDENSSEARIPLDMLARVSERTGCAFIVIHHARKPQITNTGGKKMNIRGSGALFDACQCIFVLGSEEGDETAHADHEKARITGKRQPTFAIRAVDSEDRSRLVMQAEDAEDVEEQRETNAFDQLQERVLSVVRKHPGMNTRTVCKLARKRFSDVSAALQVLESEGIVKNLAGGNKGASWHAHAKGHRP